MKKLIGKFILFIFGWKSIYADEVKTDKYVMIAAPHTSNWDFVLAMAFYWKQGVQTHFFIKDNWTKGFHGWFIRKMGGVGVTRGKNNRLVEFAVKMFNEKEKFVLLVPAEATRKRVKKWKRGFYVIAKEANVPVALGYLDYKKKIASVGKLIHLTDSFEDDMELIQTFYSTINAKYPENYNKKIY
ncbi:MAG: 1-acyl-sn-glycerol-3-phosphate acyltransferase [Flavobacteriaceae bacterium]